MRGGLSRGIDEYQEMQRPHWGNKTAPPSPPQTMSQSALHHHHHHPHPLAHHHLMSHPEQSISQRRPPGSSMSIPNPAAFMSPVTSLPLAALLQDQPGPIKLEQASHSPSLHPPQSISHANRSPLHNYRPPLPPQAHIHQLQQHQHLHQAYGPRANSLEPGESSLLGAERSRMMDDKEIGGLQQLGIVRYAPVGKGYV